MPRSISALSLSLRSFIFECVDTVSLIDCISISFVNIPQNFVSSGVILSTSSISLNRSGIEHEVSESEFFSELELWLVVYSILLLSIGDGDGDDDDATESLSVSV